MAKANFDKTFQFNSQSFKLGKKYQLNYIYKDYKEYIEALDEDFKSNNK